MGEAGPGQADLPRNQPWLSEIWRCSGVRVSHQGGGAVEPRSGRGVTSASTPGQARSSRSGCRLCPSHTFPLVGDRETSLGHVLQVGGKLYAVAVDLSEGGGG